MNRQGAGSSCLSYPTKIGPIGFDQNSRPAQKKLQSLRIGLAEAVVSSHFQKKAIEIVEFRRNAPVETIESKLSLENNGHNPLTIEQKTSDERGQQEKQIPKEFFINHRYISKRRCD
jgi:hypothetical protein